MGGCADTSQQGVVASGSPHLRTTHFFTTFLIAVSTIFNGIQSYHVPVRYVHFHHFQ